MTIEQRLKGDGDQVVGVFEVGIILVTGEDLPAAVHGVYWFVAVETTWPVTLDNPSGGVPGAPEVYRAEPFIDFGPEGYWALDSVVEGPSPLLFVHE